MLRVAGFVVVVVVVFILLNCSIPLSKYIRVYISILLLMNTYFQVFAVINSAAINIFAQVLLSMYISLLRE